ncbi:MAG: ATP-binding protein, partial [Spirochaetota bacterium]
YIRIYNDNGLDITPAVSRKNILPESSQIQIYSREITGLKKILGRTEIGFSQKTLFAGTVQVIITLCLLILIFTASIIMVIKWRITAIVTRPLEAFLDAAKSLSHGNFSSPLAIPSDDEIGLLALEFNKMQDNFKKNQDHLVHSQKMDTIGTLAGGIAHDFNNILGGIIGNISLLRYKMKSESGLVNLSEIDGYLQSVEAISNKAAALSKQLLSLSRRNELSLVPVDLCRIISDIVGICEKTFDRKVAIVSAPCPGSSVVLGDPAQIEQAILNICINAAHSMTIMRSSGEAQGGKLQITLSGPVFPAESSQFFFCNSQLPYWEISVSDEGVGIDSENISKIFDPFFTTKKKEQGSGLGMTTVYTILRHHSGFITIDSEKNKGTKVSLYIPVYEGKGEMKPTETNESDQIPKGEGLVLVADDEDYILHLAGSVLS